MKHRAQRKRYVRGYWANEQRVSGEETRLSLHRWNSPKHRTDEIILTITGDQDLRQWMLMLLTAYRTRVKAIRAQADSMEQVTK